MSFPAITAVSTYSRHIRPITACNKDDKHMHCFRIFLNQSLGQLFNKHSCYFNLKNLSSIELANWFFLKINWLVSICEDIFHEPLMFNSYSYCQSSLLLWEHPPGSLSSSVKKLGGGGGGTIFSNNNHAKFKTLFLCIRLKKIMH